MGEEALFFGEQSSPNSSNNEEIIAIEIIEHIKDLFNYEQEKTCFLD